MAASPERPLIGVGVVALRDGRVLLVRRGKPPRLGEWSLPGGRQELGETVEEAAVREVREETRLAITGVRFLTVVDLIERDGAGVVTTHYTLIDFVALAGPGEAVPGDDAAAVGWFTRAETAGLRLWRETERVIELAFSASLGSSSLAQDLHQDRARP